MIDEVKKVIIQIRAPKGSFHGEVAEGHYCVVDNAVVLTDPEGKSIGDRANTILDLARTRGLSRVCW